MAFVIFSFVFMVAGFILGALPIIGSMILALGVESYLWGVRKRVPDGSLAMDGRFYFCMAFFGLLLSAFVIFEPAPGIALKEPVPGMMMTQAIVFIIAFCVFYSKRT